MVILEDKADPGHGPSRLEGAEAAGRSPGEMIRDDPLGSNRRQPGGHQQLKNPQKYLGKCTGLEGILWGLDCKDLHIKGKKLQNPGELDSMQENSIHLPLMESHSINGKYVYACFKGLFKSREEGWCAHPLLQQLLRE